MEEEKTEQLITVQMTLTEWKDYLRHQKEARLREVRSVLRQIESADKEQKAPCPKVVDRQQEDAQELERHRKWDALSEEEKLAEVLRLVEGKADKS
jgi:hypothetical protein